MSGPGQQPNAAPQEPTYQRQRSPLEESVEQLQLNWAAYKAGEADAPNLAVFEEFIAMLIRTEVTETDRRTHGPVATVRERVDKVVKAEPYRTRLDRIAVDLHDKRRRRRAYDALLVPIHEQQVEATIADLASLCRLRRRTG